MNTAAIPAWDPNEPVKYAAEAQAVLSPGSVLLRSSLTGRCVITDQRVLKIASLCSGFATVAQHCARLSSQTGIEPAECERLLRAAMEQDLCVSRERLSGIIGRAFVSHNALARIEVIGIPTCNRPGMLNRVLGSLATHLREDQRDVLVLVIDDSTSDSMQAANAAVVAGQGKSSILRIRYMNRHSRDSFAEELSRSAGVDRDLVDFGIQKSNAFPNSAGAARNTILLQSVGRCLLSLEDDILCRIALTPGATDSVQFADQTVGRWFLASAEEGNEVQFVPGNLLELHEKALRIDASNFTLDHAAATISNSTPIDLWRRLGVGRTRVIASQMGLIGDCGIEDPMIFYLQEPEGWLNLTRNEATYRFGIRSRLGLSGSNKFIITPRIHSQAGCLGLDNRTGLPPFFPVMRGEDVVLGLLLRLCEPDGLFGLIPRAILHHPETAREFHPDAALNRAGRFSLTETINLLITGAGGVWGNTCMERLASLGRSLAEMIRSAEDRELREHLHRVIDPVLKRWLQKLVQRLEEPRPGPWTADMRRIHDQLLSGLNHFDPLTPFDLHVLPGDEQTPCRLREVVARFADFLQAWPTLMHHAPAVLRED
jgi:hypothetical protein